MHVPGVLPSMMPFRVIPGRLAVSRAIGDPEAKLPKFNGKSKVVIAKPDIYELNVEDDLDFLVLCSDGVFDKLSNQEVVNTAWKSLKVSGEDSSLHSQCKKAAKDIIKASLEKRSMDNITTVVILFSNTMDKKLPIKDLTSRNMNLTLRSNKKLLNIKGAYPRALKSRGHKKLKFIKKSANTMLPEISVPVIRRIASPYCN